MTSIFLNKNMLLLLILVPVLLLLLSFASYMRRKALRSLLDSGMAGRMIDPAANRKRWISDLCLIAAFFCIALGIARPTWDTETVQHPKTGRDLVFMLDISQSMLAEDQPPNRLASAQSSVIQCLDEIKSGRVGLVVFAGSTSIRCPLTRDVEFFKSTLDELAPDSVPIGGTRIGDAIQKTVNKVFTDEEADYRDIILITDGGDQDKVTTNSVAGLIESEARLIIIGLGSDTAASEIPVMRDNGRIAPLKYRDRTVLTKQESEKLQALSALVPDSIYINVGTSPFDLADIYRTHISSTTDTVDEHLTVERPKEQFGLFLTAALIFLSLSILPWRKRKIGNRADARRLLAVLLLLSAPSLYAGSRSASFKDGVDAYRNADYEAAIDHFSDAQQMKPDPKIDYNLGTAYFRYGDMNSAILHFERAAATAEDSSTALKASYNMGNSLYQLAFSQETSTRETAMMLLNQAISAYESALLIDAEHADTAFNLAAARNALQLVENAPSEADEDQEGTEESDPDPDAEPDQQGETENADSSNQSEQEQEHKEQMPPNLTPDEIIDEEKENKLSRTRKKHSNFAETKRNW